MPHRQPPLRVRAIWLLGLGACATQLAAVDLGSLYAKTEQACVAILVDGHLDGSGWFASRDGLAFTAAHVLRDRTKPIEVLTALGNRWPAELRAVDLGADAALIQVTIPTNGVPHLAFRRQAPDVGEEIYLAGNPLYRRGVLQRGMIARHQPTFEFMEDLTDYTEVVHVSATVQGGTSGGPWVDRRGRVVGLQSGVMSLNSLPVGLAFMVPSPPLRRLASTQQDAATPTLGLALEETWQQGREFLDRLPRGTSGLVARIVAPKGPSAAAGFNVEDVILTVDGRPYNAAEALFEHIRQSRTGQILTLRVIPAGSQEVVERQLALRDLETGWRAQRREPGHAASVGPETEKALPSPSP